MNKSLKIMDSNMLSFRAIHQNIEVEKKRQELQGIQSNLNKLKVGDIDFDSLNEMDKVDSLIHME